MAEHNELGKKGEEIARKHLVSKGYIIKDLNWRFRKNEIDIIAEKNNLLKVIEVKTRRNSHFENPRDAVTRAKQKSIINATEAYIMVKDLNMEVEFDIVTVILENGDEKIEHIEDAFQPSLL